MPIVEPEVLMDGDHPIERCEEVTNARAADACSSACSPRAFVLEGMVLKPNMVISGKKCAQKATPEQVAEATVRTLKRHVPVRGARHRVPVGRPESRPRRRCI